VPDLERGGDVYRSRDFGIAWFEDPGGNILSVTGKPNQPA
jgi:hypothetical protein